MTPEQLEAIAQRPTCCKTYGETVSLTKDERDALVAMARDGLRWRHCVTKGFPGRNVWGTPEKPVWFYPAPDNEMPVHFDNPVDAVDAAMAKEQ